MQVSATVLWLALLLQAQCLLCMAGPVDVTSEELTEGELELELSGSGETLVDTLDHIEDEEYINSLLLIEEKVMLYGGDIMLTPQQREIITEMELKQSREVVIEKRAVVKSIRNLWPNGLLPYTISSELDYRARTAITNAINEYKRRTCIRFVERTSQKDYIYFIQGSGCYSYIGRTGGRQVISIGRGCETTGIVIHEIFHALGRWHEQSRPDRDSYIRVNFDNIDKGAKPNFEKLTTAVATTNNIQYDFRSIMHYGAYAFTSNGRPTIQPLSGVSRNELGQRNGLSTNDIKHALQLYCSETRSGSWSYWRSWSACSATCGSSGRQTRIRTCVGGANCVGSRTETRTCNNVACSRWSQWSQWSSCSATCGSSGRQTRTRTCVGGTNCVGSRTETRTCNNMACSRWSQWSQWSSCSVSCGNGIQARIRTCIGGSGCSGASSDVRSCSSDCSTWGSWSLWSSCSETCGTGTNSRTRVCVGGNNCVGNSRETKSCNSNIPCSQWNSWSEWSACTVTCGAGTQIRSRVCNGGGCIGINSQERYCVNVPLCPSSATRQWTSWSSWSPCSSSCGYAGTRSRTRECSSAICAGAIKQVEKCNHGMCPEQIGNDPNWKTWGQWGTCSRSCNTGYQFRRRQCRTHRCMGFYFTIRGCNYQSCTQVVVVKPTKPPYKAVGFSSKGCKKVDISNDIPELHTLNVKPLTTNTVQGCVNLASSNGYLYVGVAGGYCISGSNASSDYTKYSRGFQCIRGNGRFSPTSLTMYMNVYSITAA